MRLIKLIALAITAIVLTVAVSVPADAQLRRKRITYVDENGRTRTRVVLVDQNGRVRTRVVVQPRSFLDAGTNVVPGERKFTDYMFTPGYGPGQGGGAVVTNFGNGRPGWADGPGSSSSWTTWGPGYSGW